MLSKAMLHVRSRLVTYFTGTLFVTFALWRAIRCLHHHSIYLLKIIELDWTECWLLMPVVVQWHSGFDSHSGKFLIFYFPLSDSEAKHDVEFRCSTHKAFKLLRKVGSGSLISSWPRPLHPTLLYAEYSVKF